MVTSDVEDPGGDMEGSADASADEGEMDFGCDDSMMAGDGGEDDQDDEVIELN